MIKGMHGLFYSAKTEELRAFFRDKLALPNTDTGQGWLIFDAPSGDFGVHPTEGQGFHEISFSCDEIHKTVAELKGRGVVFADDVTDRGWGLATNFTLPDGQKVLLYQPHYSKNPVIPQT
jgi:hypothetical protein